MKRSINVLFGVVLLASCGGGGGENPPPTSPPSTTVASVEVSPSTSALAPQQTVQLSATPKSAAGTTLSNRTITWSSSAPAVASVSAAGLVTALTPGSADISATSEGRSGTAQVTVSAPVATVAISAPVSTIVPQQSLQLGVVLKDQGGATLTGRTVTWSSSSPAAATVNGSGLVTAVAIGATTITATSEGKTGTIELTVATGTIVGSAGGTVTGGNGTIVVTVPPGAVSTNTPISITPVAGTIPGLSNADQAGTAYQVGPAGLTFSQPVTITMKYDQAAIPLWAMSGDIAVMVKTGDTWSSMSGIVVDPVARTVSGKTTSLGSLSQSIATTNGGLGVLGRVSGGQPLAGGDGVATQVLAAGSPAVTTVAVNWASVTLTPASDSVNNQKRDVLLHAGLVPTGVSTTVPVPAGVTQPTKLWRYRWRTTGQNGTLAGGTTDTGWIDSPDAQYICTNANLAVVSGRMDDVIVDILLNPGTENFPASQKIVRKQMTVYAGLKKTFEITPDLATIGPGVTQQMHFVTRDQQGNVIPPGQGTVFTWQGSNNVGTLQQSQTEYAGYQSNTTFTVPPPRVDRVDAKVQGSTTVTERFTHWDFSKVIPVLVVDRVTTTTYNLVGTAHTFITVKVNYTVTLQPASPTVGVAAPQQLQAVLTPAYNGPGLAYVWTSPGTHGTLSETNGNHSANKMATYTPKPLDPGGTDQVSVKVVTWLAGVELETLGTGTANVTVDPFRNASFSARQIAINGGASYFTTATLEIPKVPGAATYQVQGTILGAPYTRTITAATSTNTQTLNQVLDGGTVWYINLDGGYNTIKSFADQRLQLYLTQYAGSTAKYKAVP